MKFQVRHITEYQYSAPVSLCYNLAHLLPRNTSQQNCQLQKLAITPTPSYQQIRSDYFGNQTLYFSIEELHNSLTIDVISDVEVTPLFLDQSLDSSITCGQLRQQLQQTTLPEQRLVKEYLFDSPHIQCSEQLSAYTDDCFIDQQPLLAAVQDFTAKIFHEFTFDPNTTDVATPLEQVLHQRSGVCQDFAHLAIACLRSVGLPARYMSGYLETLPPPGEEKLVGADASHAWFAVYMGEKLGWVEFDPTNNVMPCEQHIVTAWGRDYADVAPLQGLIFDGGDEQHLRVSVDVKRLS
ncbi:transglutaminase family protein [Marinomonas agarivorans]|nr:transglutaminase family protein [Marinomonas agarivorans]